jgi:hypothetical protein
VQLQVVVRGVDPVHLTIQARSGVSLPHHESGPRAPPRSSLAAPAATARCDRSEPRARRSRDRATAAANRFFVTGLCR